MGRARGHERDQLTRATAQVFGGRRERLARLDGRRHPAHSTSEAALNALTRVLAAALGGSGIVVNAVCPGWIATDMGGAGGQPLELGAARVLWAVLLDDDGLTGGFSRDGRQLPW